MDLRYKAWLGEVYEFREATMNSKVAAHLLEELRRGGFTDPRQVSR